MLDVDARTAPEPLRALLPDPNAGSRDERTDHGQKIARLMANPSSHSQSVGSRPEENGQEAFWRAGFDPQAISGTASRLLEELAVHNLAGELPPAGLARARLANDVGDHPCGLASPLLQPSATWSSNLLLPQAAAESRQRVLPDSVLSSYLPVFRQLLPRRETIDTLEGPSFWEQADSSDPTNTIAKKG